MSRKLQVIDDTLMTTVLARAKASPRRRANHNFHSGDADNPHRFLNAFIRGTYCSPHRHINPPKSESFIVLSGSIALLLFDDRGNIIEHQILDETVRGVDVPPALWHTIVTLSPTAVCFEVKPGPYDPATDKEFAPWAPQENDPNAATYLQRLLELIATPPSGVA